MKKIIRNILPLAVIVFFTIATVGGQNDPVWSKPLALCRDFPSIPDVQRIYFHHASDNKEKKGETDDKQEFYLYSETSSNPGQLLKANLKDRIELWRTPVGGKMIDEPIFVDQQILLVIRIQREETGNTENTENMENAAKEPRYNLRSISQSTGLPLWQAEFVEKPSIIGASSSKISVLSGKSVQYFNPGNGSRSSQTALPSRSLSDSNFLPELPGNWSSKSFKIAESGRLLLLNMDGMVEESLELTDVTSVAVFNRSLLYLGNKLGEVVAYDLERKRKLWTVKTGGKVTYLDSVTKGILFASFDNYIYLYDRESGRQIWKKRTPGRILGKPFMNEEYLAYSTVGSNFVEIIHLETGKIVNRLTLVSEVEGGPLGFHGEYLFLKDGRQTLLYKAGICG